MATYACPDCGHLVSYLASACPECGVPVQNDYNVPPATIKGNALPRLAEREAPRLGWLPGLLGLFLGLGFGGLGGAYAFQHYVHQPFVETHRQALAQRESNLSSQNTVVNAELASRKSDMDQCKTALNLALADWPRIKARLHRGHNFIDSPWEDSKDQKFAMAFELGCRLMGLTVVNPETPPITE